MGKCKICGLDEIKYDNEICKYCGWQADTIQEENPDYIGGANQMTFNQYKQFWSDNKNDLKKENNALFAIKLSIEYYKQNFQAYNEEVLRKIEQGEIIQNLD